MSSSALTIVSQVENPLLDRKEIRCVFRAANGFITRAGAAEAIAAELKSEKHAVQILSLKGKFGDRDLFCEALIFGSPKSLDEQTQDYLRIRMLPKDQRKAAREKSKGTAAPVSAAKPGAAQPAATG
jgi:ribosomal protein S24E